METKTKNLIIAGVAGIVGGILGSVSGSNNLFVVAIVGGVFGFLTAWTLSGFLK